MIKRIIKQAPYVMALSLPFNININDAVSAETNTYKRMLAEMPVRTGAERLRDMFSIDECSRISPELNSVYQAGFLGFLTGALYGGFIDSKEAYLAFIERNQATAFESMYDAKKKMQNTVTVSFAKGALKWGWKLSLFTTSFTGLVTAISVYRGKSSMMEYLIGGAVTGGMFKISLGFKGMIAGSLVGTVLGGMCGGISLLILKVSGTTIDEVRFWQYGWRESRYNAINSAYKMQSEQPKDDLLIHHDKRFGEGNITLDAIAVVEKKETMQNTNKKEN